jgi:hypothetical protein
MDNQPVPTGFKAGIEIGPDGKSTGKIICYPSSDPNCIVVRTPEPAEMDSTGFVSLPKATLFHDDTRRKATAEINEILVKIMTPQDPRMLHVISTSDGPMLVWGRAMAMQVDDIRKSSTMTLG